MAMIAATEGKMEFMKKFCVGFVVALCGTAVFADSASTILADQPFTSTPWANGDYYTVTLELDGCMLSKTVTEFDGDDVSEDSLRIDIDLAQVDKARLEIVADAVTLWGATGYEVMCTDLVGEDCVVPNRPGEQISVPESVSAEEYLAAFADKVSSCQ